MSQAATQQFSILVENRFGVLFTITALFCARGYNVEMLTVRPEGQNGLSRIKLTVQCSSARCDQIVKQLNKVLDVVDVVIALDVLDVLVVLDLLEVLNVAHVARSGSVS